MAPKILPPRLDEPWPPNVARGHIAFESRSATVWTGKADDEHVCVTVVETSASEDTKAAFARAARRVDEQPGVLPIFAIDDDGRWVVHAPIIGALVDAPSLGWKLARKLELFIELGEHVASIHRAGKVHGGLTPWAVALDDEMRPLLVSSSGNGIWSAGDGYEYLAPELMLGGEPTKKSDVYALGRILAFLVVGAHLGPETEPVPKLDELKSAPAGLSRIVRRCTIANSDLRYDSVAELVSDVRSYGDFEKVGLALATAIELNKTGMSTPPERTTRTIAIERKQPVAAAPRAPAKKEAKRETKKDQPIKLLAGLSLVLVVLFGAVYGEDVVTGVRVWRARHALASEDLGERVHAAQKLIALGDTDLQKVNLVRTKLDGAELAGGNFRGANFKDATAIGANMTDTNVIEVQYLETVTCDVTTQMPQGWLCTNGHFANSEK